MAVPEQTPYIEYTANGVATSFALGFGCESKDHLIVTLDGVEPPIASWSLDGGNVVFTTAPAAGQKITLQRNTPFGRTTDYQSFNNSFRPQTVNSDFDRLWLKLQELGVADWLMKIYVDRLHREQKEYIDQKDDELKNYLIEEIRKQGVALDQLEDYYNRLMQKLAEIALEGGWTDSVVATWSGRTQESKNKDSITGLDIGVGDGVTSDTAKFTAFESQYSNVVVDLRGKTYVVNTLPTKNIYKNGYFLVGGKLLIPNGFYEDIPKGSDFILSSLSNEVEFQDARWTLVPSSARPVAADNALQTIVYDEINNYAYSHQNTASGDVENAYISRYPLYQPDGDYVAIDSMSISTIIGHQSMAVDYQGKLWGSGRDTALGAIRYKYNANSEPSDIQYFKLHPSILMDVSISYDQKWLVAQGQATSTSTIVRVFDLQKLIQDGAGDYSARYSYEFTIPDFWQAGTQYVQGVASDGVFVYLLTGRFYATTNTCLHVYTLDGRLVKEVHNFNIGVKSAIDPNNSYYEAESISFSKVNSTDQYPSLMVGVAFGSSGEGRVNRIYTLGYNTKHTVYPLGRVNKYVSGFLGINSLTSVSVGNTSNCAISMQGVGRSEGSIGRISWTGSGDPLWGNSDLYMRSGSGVRGVYTTPSSGDSIYRAIGYTARNDGSSVESIADYWYVDSGASETVTPTKKTWQLTDIAGNYGLRGQINGDGSIDILPSSVAPHALKINRSGSGYLQKFERSEVLSGGFYVSSPRFQVCALNGKSLAFSTTTGETSDPVVHLVLSNDGTSFSPLTTNKINLGSASSVYSNIYLQNPPIATSDERLKQQFRSLEEREKSAALEIKNSICLFKFNDAVDLKGDGARWHVGVKAQQVISIMESHGLKPLDYGFVCYDEWDAKEAIIEDDEITEEAIEAGSRYAIRYDELSMFILAAL